MKKILLVLAMIMTLMFSNMAFASGNTNNGPDKITLRSRVEKSVKANVALATLGVRVQSNSLSSAQRQVNEAVSAVVDALTAAGISKNDIKTARFTVNSFNHDEKAQATYIVNNNITVKIHDIASTGKILDAAFEAGANQIQGINFQYENDAAMQDELMKQAVVNGRKQANMIVAADGRTLGRLLDVSIYGVNTQAADEVATMRAMSTNSKVGSQVFSGDIVLSAEVNLTFEIQQ